MASRKYSIKILTDLGKLSDDGILAYDLGQESVLYCNRAFGKILELSLDEVTNGGWNSIRGKLKDEMGSLLRAFQLFKVKSKISNLELRVASDKEKNKYISVDAYLPKPDILVSFVKDITKSKEHLNYIVEYGARKNAILDTITHNLAGPLNMIANLLDVLDQVSKDQNYKRIEQPARLIRENTLRCIDQIHSFLSEEHLASSAIPVEANRFDVIAKIRIVVGRYAQFNPNKRIMIASPVNQLFVTGDDVKFFQVINNLISNSMKFTNERGKIVIEVRRDDASFVVSVKDNGIGIPEYLHPHLFRKNTPAARPGLRGEKSIGLGLHIVKKLVDMMKGDITFKSEEGKGTMFSISLPRN